MNAAATPHSPTLIQIQLTIIFTVLLCNFSLTENTPEFSGHLFYHLRSSSFWHLQALPGFEGLLLQSKVRIITPNAIRQSIEYVYLDLELWAIFQNPQERSILTQVLISEWFSGHAENIEQLLQVNAFAELQEQLQATGGKIYDPQELKDEQQVIVRDGAFRKIVVSTYNHHCAFCLFSR